MEKEKDLSQFGLKKAKQEYSGLISISPRGEVQVIRKYDGDRAIVQKDINIKD